MSGTSVNEAKRHPRHGATSFRHGLTRAATATITGVVGFGLVFGGTYYWKTEHAFTPIGVQEIYTAPSPTAEGPQGPADPNAGQDLNILLIGSDVRNGENANIGGDVADGMRSDATIIMHISADRSRVELISIPRDSRVRVSDCKLFDGSTVKGWTGKFNIAFANGGKNGNVAEAAACTMQTLSDLTGLTFDHYAVVDFVGFKNMINALDGVPMCLEEPIYDRKAKLDLEAGAQVLDGETSLAWARSRYGRGDGSDLGRIDGQQELLMNMFRKALGLNLLTDVPSATSFVRAAAESATMDPDLASLKYLLGLGYSLRNLDKNGIELMTVPWAYPGDKSGDVVWTADADIVWQRMVNDIPVSGGTPETPTASPTPTTSTSPDPTGSPEPSVSPSPERETEAEILADCSV